MLWALRLQFFLSGALFATWGVHVPTVKAHYGFGEQVLALAMLASGFGALVALTQAGRWIGRRGPRVIARLSGVAYSLSIGALLAFDEPVLFFVVAFAMGTFTSVFDVAINAEASEIERRSGRPVMSGIHAMFSLGGMVGAAVGSALLHAGFPPKWHLAGAALLGAVGVLMASRAMLRDVPRTEAASHGLSLPRGALKWIGLLAALGLITEGAMYDWSVLYLAQELHAEQGLAALAYASFSAAMALARFRGDAVRARVAPVPLLAWSGSLGAIGMAVALWTDAPAIALIGFALVGLGFANVVPVLFSAASVVPGVPPAHGIAAVSGMGYLGLMAGPPLIGLLAHAASLTAALGCVVLFAAVLALSARPALRLIPAR